MKEKFNKYIELLNKWQKSINLVSNSTLEEAYARHIEDSLELEKYLPNKEAKIYDLGSGGGFPALPLAISGYNNISMIESDSRKCVFLQQVKIAYGLKTVKIINDRIENISDSADFITSRAFSSLFNTFDMAKNLISDNTVFVLLKGEKLEEEIKRAKRKYDFNYEVFPSSISPTISIIVIKNVSLHV